MPNASNAGAVRSDWTRDEVEALVPQVIVEDLTDSSGTKRLVGYATDTKYIVPTSFRPNDTLPHILRWQVTVVLDAKCRDAAVLSRLETNPPAALYGAPPARQKSVIRNPETLSKLGVTA